MATQFIFGVRGMRKIVQRYKKILNYPNFPKGKCENQYFLLLVSLLYFCKVQLRFCCVRSRQMSVFELEERFGKQTEEESFVPVKRLNMSEQDNIE